MQFVNNFLFLQITANQMLEMRKYCLLFFLLIIFIPQRGFANDSTQYALRTSATTIGLGFSKITDPYLSPFEYNGYEIKLQNNSRRFLKPDDNRFSYSNQILMEIGNGTHPSGKNSMLFFNANYMLGGNYHFRPADNLMILAGGSWDIDVGGKYLGRNINNPFSLDLYTNINATAEIQYLFKLWKQDFRLQLGAVSPVLGCMFVPTQNVSYFELFMLNNRKNAFHFSSLHNKRAVFSYFNLDFLLKSQTWRLSIQDDYMKYSANDMVFKKQGFVISIGTVVHLYTFNGKKDKIPTNFIHSYE